MFRVARRLAIGAVSGALIGTGFIAALAPAPSSEAAGRKGVPGTFDYWALALSWSPTYCASTKGQNDRAQCRSGRAYAFVVHGLWPQYHHGWPQYCRTKNRWVPRRLIDRMLDIMPSPRLVGHQWRKHGSCSGLNQQGYFQLTRDLFGSITIPSRFVDPGNYILTKPNDLEAAFLAANPRLTGEMISVHCGNRRDRANLQELRICFGRDLKPVACGANGRRDCRAQELVLPPVRQGQSAEALSRSAPEQ